MSHDVNRTTTIAWPRLPEHPVLAGFLVPRATTREIMTRVVWMVERLYSYPGTA